MLHRARRWAFAPLAFAFVVATTPVALAAGIDPATLNPVPPDFYSCRAVAAGAICRAHTVDPYELEATGIFCGSGPGQVELLDSGIRDVWATRWYDSNLDMTRRQRSFLFRDTFLTNPATGQTLTYSQHNMDNEVLATPGDLGSATLFSHGHLTMTAKAFGSVLLSAGQVVISPAGDVEFRGGLDQVGDYFAGNTSVVDDLCAALGTPNS